MTEKEKEQWLYEMGYFKTGGGLGCIYLVALCILFWVALIILITQCT